MKKTIDYDHAIHGNIKMTYDPFEDADAPAHDDFAYKVLLDPIRSQHAKTNRNESKRKQNSNHSSNTEDLKDQVKK